MKKPIKDNQTRLVDSQLLTSVRGGIISIGPPASTSEPEFDASGPTYDDACERIQEWKEVIGKALS